MNDIHLNDDMHVNMYDNTIADHRFNELEMSTNFQHIREPKFLCCIPLARGICCGMVSLKFTLIAIALLDITMGIASICSGFIFYSYGDLNAAVAISICINSLSLVFAVITLVAMAK